MDGQEDLIVITGPTCSGKTGCALRLAGDHPLEVISADSMQVYRHMDIATAKPTAAERRALPHHIIDVVNPDEEFHAAMFCAMARREIPRIRVRGGIPVVLGGTGLYIKALVHGLAPAPERSERLRKALRSLLRDRGAAHLMRMLRRLDPETAGRIASNDAVRVVRSLEIILLTGRRASDVMAGHGFRQADLRARIACIMPDRERLFADIDARVLRMMDSGLLDETRRLLDMGYDPGLRSMQTLAYRHVVHHLRSGLGMEECVALIRRDTRRFAKRQITWMKAQPGHEIFPSAQAALQAVSRWVQACRRDMPGDGT